MIINFLGFVIVLSIVVFVHEFGHYYAAIKCGVIVEEFSIGFGKSLYSFTDKRLTKWSIRLIPIGGFVKMYGERLGTQPFDTKSFSSQTIFRRAIIIAAGPLANYLLATILLTCIYSYVGTSEALPIIQDVIEHSPADKAGLKKGDKVLSAENIEISQFAHLRQIIATHPDQSIVLVVDRNGDRINILVTPKLSPSGIGYIGVQSPHNQEQNHNIIHNFNYAVGDVINTSRLILLSITQIISGSRTSEQLGGVISIAKESGTSLSHGPLELIAFIAFLSINLGLFNLLPLPVLDGGHLALLLYEALTKGPLNSKLQSIYYRSGIVIIIFLFIISSLNDIKKLL